MDIQFDGGELHIDDRKLAEVTNAKVMEMYEQIREEMGDAGRGLTFESYFQKLWTAATA